MTSARRRSATATVSAPRRLAIQVADRPTEETSQRPKVIRSRAKRRLDLILACSLLVASIPLWAAIACAIRLAGGGPILFRQQRVGLGGKSFAVMKFRTMRHGASPEIHERYVAALMSSSPPQDVGSIHKLQNDERVTRVGRWLRKTSLDELPQLINVLRGEMSMVGPRPPMPYEVSKYEPWQRGRLNARPGITGLWQTSGRNRLTYREMCELDIRYIHQWSLWLDLKIILSTPWVMFVDRGGAE